jgi:hypothetical protein
MSSPWRESFKSNQPHEMNRPSGRRRVKTRRMFLALFLIVLLLRFGAGTSWAQSEEEHYVQEIRSLLVVADLHLTAARDALLQCLGDFDGCVSDSRLVVGRLNLSRDGLAAVLSSAGTLDAPARYGVVHDLVSLGVRDSISGIGFHVEGLIEGSLDKFEAGSDLTEVGRSELQEAVDLLNSTPPRAELEALLFWIVIAIVATSVTSVTILLLWYRKQVQRSAAADPATKP